MKKELLVSNSPHIQSPMTVEKIMWGVVIALMPSFVASAYFFGIRAVLVVLVSVVAAVLTEYLIVKFMMKEDVTIFDGSAVITGILLAFNVPSSIPFWMIIVGAIVAIAIGKMPFGGLGKNPFNPALVGRAFMLAAFPVQMTTWPKPLVNAFKLVDAETAATPLGLLKEGLKNGETMNQILHKLPSYWDLFIGNIGGSLGETSVLAILIGAAFLLYRKIITWHIPVAYLSGLFIITFIFWMINPSHYADPVFHLLSGGAMLGAWFMATDMVTSQMTTKGMIIFGIVGGILCGVIRLWGSYPEGCSYSILIMNAFVPLINRWTKPRRFGTEVNYG